MKTLIILAGLPGVGKSYTARLLAKKIPNSFHFDGDLFAKKDLEARQVDFINLPREEQIKDSLKRHKIRLDKIRELFKKYDTIFLDSVFDLRDSRKMYYKFGKESKVKLIVFELQCSKATVEKRLASKAYQREHIPGYENIRWKVYQDFKSEWIPIKHKNHYIINCDKDVEEQLARYLKLVT